MARAQEFSRSITLHELLAAEIRAQGSISVARYMELALGHPEHGYYMKRDPLGASGDFTTAPEISQLFGELVGIWCAHSWQQMGSPEKILLVELGPGRGTLMQDLLRASKSVPGFRDALEVHLVEMSPTLQALQRERLKDEQVQWHETLTTLPDGPALFVANEFFDALPIHQYEKSGALWYERRIALDAAGNFIFTRAAMPAVVPEAKGAVEGDIVERSPLSEHLMEAVAARIAQAGGAALVVDYGYGAGHWGDSLQALRAHQFHEVLEAPGEADLTAHVNFAALARVSSAAGAKVWGALTQRAFLNGMGIGTRLAVLLKGAEPTVQAELVAGVERLTSPDQMGDLFKVMAVTHPSLKEVAGF